MDVMQARRRLLMMPHGIDTSPKIAAYGKACALANTGERDVPYDSITDWYVFAPKTIGQLTIYYETPAALIRNDGNYQFYAINAESTMIRDWYYNTSATNKTRTIGWTNFTLQEIRFTVITANIDDVYAYVVETGQIFFAGKNTIYYGHRNISELN